MVAPMRRLAFLALLWVVSPTWVSATALPDLSGSWIGLLSGVEVEWEIDDSGRLRRDGRAADYAVSGDSLIVRFDPPAQAPAGTPRETAVYRFLASQPDDQGQARLLIYGFDLGRHGVYLIRETPAPPLPEDAAPAVPATPGPQSAATPQPGRPH
jgi:hypothetical protein